ncbi:MAG: hypothetical protein KC550_06880, partial [Nanoarchaeota archaeon]|nr:hypothetical protein [Nanoarchaeota archaeon]
NNNKFSKILEELKKLPVISNLVKLTHFESDLSPTIIVMEDIHHGRDFSKKSNYLSDLKKLELLRQKLGITLLGIEGLLNNYSNIKKMKDMIIGGEDWLIYTLLTSYKNKYELIGLENPNNIIKEIPPIYSEEFIVNIMEKREQFATEIFLQEIKKKEKSIGILFYGKAHIDIYSRIVDIVRTEKQRIWLKKEVDRMIESQEISSDVGIVALLKLKGERIFGRKPNIIIIKIDDDAN